MIPPVREPQHLQDLIHPFLIRLLIIQKNGENDILLHVQLGDKLKRLEDKSDVLPPEHGALIFLHGEQILPVQQDLPCCRRIQPAHTV